MRDDAKETADVISQVGNLNSPFISHIITTDPVLSGYTSTM